MRQLAKRAFGRVLTAGAFSLALLMAAGTEGKATPSTEVWTCGVMDVQPAGVWHVTYDTYSGRRVGGDLSTDLGLTYGVRLSKIVNAEVGFDWFSRVANPVYLNAKIGVAEGTFGENTPGASFGIFGVGTKKADAAAGVAGTNQNVLNLVVGKTVAKNTRVHIGAYSGNKDVLVSSTGKKENNGFSLAVDYGFRPTAEGYNRFVLAADYTSGRNVIGGSSVGLTWNFAKNAGVIVGPVWFNDKGINGKPKWTTQIDINF